MDAKARKALETIRDSVAAKRYTVSQHFTQRMDERAFFWADVLAVLDRPGKVRDDGRDKWGRPKWKISGNTPDGVALEMVCAIETDERGRSTVFITLY